MEKIVTIFGGSKCGEESEEYGQARRVLFARASEVGVREVGVIGLVAGRLAGRAA